MRLALEKDKQRFEAQSAASKEFCHRTKVRAELPYGHIKRNLKTDSFMLREQEEVRDEISILATC